MIWLPVLLVLIFVIMLSVRGIILRRVLASLTIRIESLHYRVNWDGASFKGLKSLYIKGIHIQSENNENEVYVDSLMLNIRIIPLLIKKIRIDNLDCRRISIRYLLKGSDTTVIQPGHSASGGVFDQLSGKNLADRVNKYVRRFFSYVPSSTSLRLFEIRLIYKEETSMVSFRDLEMRRGRVKGTLILSGKGSTALIPVEGWFDKSSYRAKMRLTNPGDSLLPVPVLMDKYGIVTGFDTVDIALDMSDRKHRQLNITGEFNFSGFELGGERVSAKSIIINRFQSSFLVHLGSNYVELDSATRVDLNKIRIRPFIHVDMAVNPAVEFKLLPVNWKAGDFFSSLPEGMFTSLSGFKADGTLHYFLNFYVDMNNPDSLKFETELTSEKFNILGYGIDDYRMLNGSFYHQVFEKGQLKAAFVVGSDNPDFVPFEQISAFLRAAVMTSEDGGFFYHHGFNPEAFRESIVTNIREKRFARGGSTLSMQLVKNVFLMRNKTIARKIEEALIVWLIENQNLVSKKRMYEVYLNLIEWGPGIFGVNQASRFYFNKKPQDLNLQQSIFMACIVPNPKWYRYTFEKNGVPKLFFGNYFHRMEELMVKKQFIEASDTIGVNPYITLTGVAANAFTARDTIRDDSLILKELEFIPATVELNNITQ